MRLTAAYARNQFAPNVKQVLALIQRLAEMEAKMAQVPMNQITAKQESSSADMGSGFTVEEMERAQSIIAEQDRNPFEI